MRLLIWVEMLITLRFNRLIGAILSNTGTAVTISCRPGAPESNPAQAIRQTLITDQWTALVQPVDPTRSPTADCVQPRPFPFRSGNPQSAITCHRSELRGYRNVGIHAGSFRNRHPIWALVNNCFHNCLSARHMTASFSNEKYLLAKK
jgi:hypothetical protein